MHSYLFSLSNTTYSFLYVVQQDKISQDTAEPSQSHEFGGGYLVCMLTGYAIKHSDLEVRSFKLVTSPMHQHSMHRCVGMQLHRFDFREVNLLASVRIVSH